MQIDQQWRVKTLAQNVLGHHRGWTTKGEQSTGFHQGYAIRELSRQIYLVVTNSTATGGHLQASNKVQQRNLMRGSTFAVGSSGAEFVRCAARASTTRRRSPLEAH
jgi:hypothetical protein